MSKKYFYKAFGFIWRSDFPIPEFFKTTDTEYNIDIIFDKIPENISYTRTGVNYKINKSAFFLTFDNVGNFFSHKGETIIIEKHRSATNKDIRALLLTTVLGVVLNQRKLFPVHASSVLIKDSAILISGSSGVGKSTLASYFAKEGYPVITDDISAIKIVDELPYIIPSFPSLKLWPDSIKKLSFEEKKMSYIRKDIAKKRLIQESYFCSVQKLIKYIFVIKPINEKKIVFKEISGVEKFNYLKANMYRLKLIEGEENKLFLFNHISNLAKNVKLFEINRPKYPFTIYPIKKLILKQIKLNDK